MLCKFKKQCSSRPFPIQNKNSTHVFLSPLSSPDRCEQHRNSSISIKRRKISTCCFVCELLNVKTFAWFIFRPSLRDQPLLSAWTRRSLIMSHRSKQLPVSQSRNVLSDYAGVERRRSDTWSHFQASTANEELFSQVCDRCLYGEAANGKVGETKGGRAAGVATAEESSTGKQTNLKWLEGNSHGAAFSQSSWTRRAGVSLEKSVSPPANLQCSVPFSTASHYFLFSM